VTEQKKPPIEVNESIVENKEGNATKLTTTKTVLTPEQVMKITGNNKPGTTTTKQKG
jgi:hypothetical protein